MISTPFFIFFTLAVASANLLPLDEIIVDEEIVLNNNSNLDVSDSVNDSPTETKSIGGEAVVLNKEFKFNSSSGNPVVIENAQLTSVSVEIPDQTLVKAPDTWNGQITPPKISTTTSTPISGFVTPTTSIIVGSSDVVLVFDSPVTLFLNGVTGTTAYKIPGGQWIIISGCTGTFENPDNPPVNGECSIGDGTNTKIVTYHFTEFTGLSTPAPQTSTTTGNSGGHGNTGVGSPRIFGPSSSGGSSSGYYVPTQQSQSVFPSWFDNVTDWYREGKISALEFLNAYQWITENVLK